MEKQTTFSTGFFFCAEWNVHYRAYRQLNDKQKQMFDEHCRICRTIEDGEEVIVRIDGSDNKEVDNTLDAYLKHIPTDIVRLGC